MRQTGKMGLISAEWKKFSTQYQKILTVRVWNPVREARRGLDNMIDDLQCRTSEMGHTVRSILTIMVLFCCPLM